MESWLTLFRFPYLPSFWVPTGFHFKTPKVLMNDKRSIFLSKIYCTYLNFILVKVTLSALPKICQPNRIFFLTETISLVWCTQLAGGSSPWRDFRTPESPILWLSLPVNCSASRWEREGGWNRHNRCLTPLIRHHFCISECRELWKLQPLPGEPFPCVNSLLWKKSIDHFRQLAISIIHAIHILAFSHTLFH